MNPYYYSLTILKVLCKRLTFLTPCYRWSILHEVEVDYAKTFTSINTVEAIAQKRFFLESTTLMTNIRYKIIDEEVRHNNLEILNLMPHPTLFTPRQTVVLYLHGGLYCVGSARTHQEFCSLILRGSKCPVYIPNYRLAPEHASPAAVEDALSAYEYLTTVAGYDANHIVVAGDCAGGGLAAALILALKERQQPMPAALVMLSPLVDLSELVDGAWKSKRTKDLVTPYEDHLCAKTYCGDNDPRSPMLSPIYGDLTRFPPTLIQVGSFESQRPTILRFAEKLRQSNVNTTCEEYETEVRVFHMIDGSRHQDEAIRSICKYISDRVVQ